MVSWRRVAEIIMMIPEWISMVACFLMGLIMCHMMLLMVLVFAHEYALFVGDAMQSLRVGTRQYSCGAGSLAAKSSTTTTLAGAASRPGRTFFWKR